MEFTTMVLRGRAGSDVILKHDPNSRAYARFRMAVPHSRRTDSGTWQELDSSWYTVKAWGALAQRAMLSIRKGQPIIVVGRPAAQAWKNDADEVVSGMAIHAIAMGHDLGFGVSTFSKLDRLPEAGGALDEGPGPDLGARDPLSEGAENDDVAAGSDPEDLPADSDNPPF